MQQEDANHEHLALSAPQADATVTFDSLLDTSTEHNDELAPAGKVYFSPQNEERDATTAFEDILSNSDLPGSSSDFGTRED